jgi:hypothetical protein
MKIDPKVKFMTCRQFVSKHLPNIVAKIMDKCVLALLTKCETTNVTFDLWMSIIGFDTFSLIMIDDVC